MDRPRNDRYCHAIDGLVVLHHRAGFTLTQLGRSPKKFPRCLIWASTASYVPAAHVRIFLAVRRFAMYRAISA
jgi:hypothetical protein